MVKATSSTLRRPLRLRSRSTAWRTAGSSGTTPLSSKPVTLNTSGETSVPAPSRTLSRRRAQARDKLLSLIMTGSGAAEAFDLLIRVVLQMAILSEADIGLRRDANERRPGAAIGARLNDSWPHCAKQTAVRLVALVGEARSGRLRSGRKEQQHLHLGVEGRSRAMAVGDDQGFGRQGAEDVGA